MRDFRELKVWEKSHQLTIELYKATTQFPDNEKYGLTNQIRRAVASIPTNIAEGCGRGSEQDFARFLTIAYGSANEIDYLILLSKDLALIDVSYYNFLENNIAEIKKMLAALIRKIRES